MTPLADRMHRCIADLQAIHQDPLYDKDWEDLETKLERILILLELLRDTMTNSEVNDDD
jgi:hypothetical protein